MRELTQTSLNPGNCWQTCIACILELDPETLPSQVEHDMRRVMGPNGDWTWEGRGYGNVLGNYLRKHHGLAYVQLHYPEEIWSAVAVRPCLHMMTGRTERTAQNGSRHVVVGENGSIRWDPQPSRAGLLDEIEYGFLIPFPKMWEETWTRMREDCLCPACVSVAKLTP